MKLQLKETIFDSSHISSYGKFLWYLQFFSTPQTFLNDMQIRCGSVKRRKNKKIKPRQSRRMVAVWSAGVELANWKQCEAVALATCNLEGWEPGRRSAGKKFIILFHFHTDVAEYFALPYQRRSVWCCCCLRCEETWNLGAMMQVTRTSLWWPRQKRVFITLHAIQYQSHLHHKHAGGNPAVFFLTLPYKVYMFSQFWATLLLRWALLKTPTHFTLNRGDAQALTLIPHQLLSAPTGRQADRRTI